MHSPTEDHFRALKRILRYIKGTVHYGLQLQKQSTHALLAYSDADWAGCPDTRRSTTSYAIFLGSNLISWSSKKQSTVSRSNAEAEYRSLAVATADIAWIVQILRDLHVTLPASPTLCCTIKVPSSWLVILLLVHGPSILPLTTILSVSLLLMDF